MELSLKGQSMKNHQGSSTYPYKRKKRKVRKKVGPEIYRENWDLLLERSTWPIERRIPFFDRFRWLKPILSNRLNNIHCNISGSRKGRNDHSLLFHVQLSLLFYFYMGIYIYLSTFPSHFVYNFSWIRDHELVSFYQSVKCMREWEGFWRG